MMLCAMVLAATAMMAPAAASSSIAPSEEVSQSATCPGHNTTCVLDFYHRSPGTLSVDADVFGRDNDSYRWILVISNTSQVHCYGDLKVVEPARSWVCHNVPVGRMQLRMHTESHGGSLRYRYNP